MNFKGEKILITGGLGFIGSNLSLRLKKLGADLTIFDIASGDDIQDYKNLKKAISQKFDVIFHLAGFSGSKESNENIEKSFKINTFATINLFIDIAKSNGILTIYGDGKQLRDYIFIDDLVEAFVLAAEKNASGEIYN